MATPLGSHWVQKRAKLGALFIYTFHIQEKPLGHLSQRPFFTFLAKNWDLRPERTVWHLHTAVRRDGYRIVSSNFQQVLLVDKRQSLSALLIS